MARLKKNGFIVTSYILLVGTILGYAGISNFAPAEGMIKGELWYELRSGCLLVAAIAVVVWIFGFLKMTKSDRR